MRTSRTLSQFPFIAEQVGEEVIAPLGRRGGPGDFQAAADGITGSARSKFALPAEALFLDGGRFRLRAYQFGIAGAVSFTEGVTAGNKRNSLLVVHGHASESLSDVSRRGNRIRLPIRPFRIHINQTHLHSSQRV